MSNENYHDKIQEITPFTLNLTVYKTKENKTVLELRKKIVLGTKNEKFIKKLIKTSFSDKPIKAQVIIAYQDRLLAKIKAKEMGLLE